MLFDISEVRYVSSFQISRRTTELNMKQRIFLIKQLALSDFKIRYYSSILGYLWSFLNPMIQYGVYFLIFSVFARFQVPNYGLYLLTGIILWHHFGDATNSAMDAIIHKSQLIRNIYFPRHIIVIASNFTSLITFSINLSVLFIFIILSDSKLHATICLLPVYLILFHILVSGFSLFLSALNVTFRDAQHYWGLMFNMGYWLTPIVYPLSMIPEKYKIFFKYNPLCIVIESIRDILVYGKLPALHPTIFLSLFSILLLGVGFLVFTRLSHKFAEVI